jgi:hypothetical protein
LVEWDGFGGYLRPCCSLVFGPVDIDLGEFVVFVDCPVNANNRPVLEFTKPRKEEVFGYACVTRIASLEYRLIGVE